MAGALAYNHGRRIVVGQKTGIARSIGFRNQERVFIRFYAVEESFFHELILTSKCGFGMMSSRLRPEPDQQPTNEHGRVAQ